MRQKLNNLLVQIEHFAVTIALLVYGLLAYKAPFSERTLVANFEPFPDSFHYILPAWCFITDFSWTLCRPGFPGYPPAVGPVYSILLIPAFLVFGDPRAFYFVNFLFGLLSVVLAWFIARRITQNSIVSTAITLLIATTYQLYWFPALAMAETVLIFFFLANIALLFFREKKWYIAAATIAAVLLVLTKFAYLPLTAVFLLNVLYTLIERKLLTWQVAGVICGAAAVITSWYAFVQTDLGTYFFAFQLSEVSQSKSWFSLFFMREHLPRYLNSLVGNPTLVLWDIRPLVSQPIGYLGIAGLVIGMVKHPYKRVAVLLSIATFAQILFISTFYAFDARYTLISIPVLILGILFLWKTLVDKATISSRTLGYLCAVILVIPILLKASALKAQVAINLKYSETPWFYVATRHIDTTLAEQESNSAVLITAIPPYFFDFFGSQKYDILPLAPEQERNTKADVYGAEHNYSDLLELYEIELISGKELYYTNYGLGNAAYMREALDRLELRFESTLLSKGCHEACNVYKISAVKSSSTE